MTDGTTFADRFTGDDAPGAPALAPPGTPALTPSAPSKTPARKDYYVNPQTGELTDRKTGMSIDEPPPGGHEVMPPNAPPAESKMGGFGPGDPRYYADRAAKQQKDWDDFQTKETPILNKLRKEYLSGSPKIPELQPVGKPPNPDDFKKGSFGFLGAMAALGAIAGRGTRNAGNAALNAFAGAMNGWQEGNLQAYKQKSDEWEQKTFQTLQNNKQLQDKYHSILANKELTIEQMMAAAKLVAIEHQDKISHDALEAENFGMFTNAFDKRNAIQEKAVDSTMTLLDDKHFQTEQWQARAKWYLETPEGQAAFAKSDAGQRARIQQLIQLYGPQGTITQQWQQGEHGVSGNPEAFEIARAVERGEQPPTITGMSRGGLAGDIRREWAHDNFELSRAQLEWESARRQVMSLTGPQMTRFFGLANSVVSTIDEVKRLSEQMQLGGIPAMNAFKLAVYIGTEGNSPKGILATQYQSAVNTLKEEFANLANGGYAPTEPAWKLADAQINGNYGVYQLPASLDEARKLINIRVTQLKSQGLGGDNRYLPGAGAASAPEAPPPASEIRYHNGQAYTRGPNGEAVPVNQ